MHMNKWLFAAVAAGFVFLFSVPALIRVPTDIFAGLQYTEDQKVKISKIHEDIKSRADAVIKDDKLNPDQKGAFLQGFERMERSEIYKVLTPEQQAEVGKRMRELRQEAQKEREKKKAQQP